MYTVEIFPLSLMIMAEMEAVSTVADIASSENRETPSLLDMRRT